MATKYLILLRHGKSDWSQQALSDDERPLNARGQSELPAVAKWFKQKGIRPDNVLCSSARRTRQTLQVVLDNTDWGLAEDVIEYRDKLYLATAGEIVAQAQSALALYNCVLLVGHNPGIENALRFFTGEAPRTHDGKIMTTSSCALIRFESADGVFEAGQLDAFIRAKELSVL